MIYLDYNGTTPVDPRVAEVMTPFIHSYFGNPSSSHAFGVSAKNGMVTARAQVANLLGASPEEIVFSSGGTESNNHALIGTVRALRKRGNHIITSAVEHPAISNVCDYLENHEGCKITRIPVDGTGQVDHAAVSAAFTEQTILVTIMHANNEVGTIQPIREIADAARKRGIRVHTDAAQSIGKIPVNVDELGVDLLTVAGHKLYAPKGVGALYVRNGTPLENLMFGAPQENGMRPGTENLIEISALGKACEIISETPLPTAAYRDRLADAFPHARVNGHPTNRLPNTLSIGFENQEAQGILDRLNRVCASAGAACHSGKIQISAVLQAMNVPNSFARGTIRLSTGRFTSDEDIDEAIRDIKQATAS